MTNYEKIKAMSVEEMAMELDRINPICTDISCPAYDMCIKNENASCDEVWKQWLESEVEEDG